MLYAALKTARNAWKEMLLPTHRQFSRVLGIDDCINFDFVCGIKGREREREEKKRKITSKGKGGGRGRRERMEKQKGERGGRDRLWLVADSFLGPRARAYT